MKYKMVMLTIFVTILTIFGAVKADNSLYGKCIYLDPGHGGIELVQKIEWLKVDVI